VCGRRVEHQAAIALVKRSPKMTANWAFAMTHSRGAIFHSFAPGHHCCWHVGSDPARLRTAGRT